MSKFALGMPTLIELPELEANIELCRKLGLSFVELNMNCPAYNPQSLGAERLSQLNRETGVGFTLHLPEEIDLASFQPSIRQGHFSCCKEAIAWAGEAGISIVNLHLNSGVYFSLPDQRVWLYEKYKSDFLSALEAAFDELLKLAEAQRVTVCIENGGNFGRSFVREALDKLLATADGWLGLTWDVGHDAGSGFAERAVFEQLQERISHMHIHDWDGTRAHQILFSGKVDVAAMLGLAKQLDVGVVIETKTVESLVESVRRLDERGMR
ncbi:MAG: sugar phosphate isomerase/epimerase [Phycisphaerae bacterium]|nr:sugar phosphate isomerase/epimerase [Phycisphaerae bacterium]